MHDMLDLLGESPKQKEGFPFDRALSLLAGFIQRDQHLEFAAKLYGGKDYCEEVLG